MRSGIHGTFATLLLMVPVLSIPALAIFGIPQFAPVVASPLEERSDTDRERRVGQSATLAGGGFVDGLEDAATFGSAPDGFGSEAAPGSPGESVPLRDRPQNPDVGNAAAEKNPRLFDFPRSQEVVSTDGAGNEGFGRPTLPPQEGQAPGLEARQGLFDSRQPMPHDLPGAKLQNISMPGGRGPQVYQRQRDPAPQQPDVRQPVIAGEPLTWQGAVRRLNELEIRNFRLQPGHRENQFVFICSYTPSDSPRVSYRFEAEADEPLRAVEKVLEQIVEWQKRRQID